MDAKTKQQQQKNPTKQNKKHCYFMKSLGSEVFHLGNHLVQSP